MESRTQVIVYSGKCINNSNGQNSMISNSCITPSSSSMSTSTYGGVTLPSPSSSPVCPSTPQRLYYCLPVISTNGSETRTPTQGTSESGSERPSVCGSSPLPPAYPWMNHWGVDTSVHLSPVSPDRVSFIETSPNQFRSDESLDPLRDSNGVRRGRPRLDDINSLILESTASPSGIRCDICTRVFPREKSLQVTLFDMRILELIV